MGPRFGPGARMKKPAFRRVRMPRTGFEPARLAALPPQSSASASSATWASCPGIIRVSRSVSSQPRGVRMRSFAARGSPAGPFPPALCPDVWARPSLTLERAHDVRRFRSCRFVRMYRFATLSDLPRPPASSPATLRYVPVPTARRRRYSRTFACGASPAGQ